MAHPLEVATYLSTYLGKEVYCDDIDVVDDSDETIGTVWWVTLNTYAYQALDAEGNPVGEVHHFPIQPAKGATK